MRKVYSKPDIVFENFTMSTNIAGDCEQITSTQSRGACGLNTRDGVIFTGSVSACNVYYEDQYGTGNNALCYHVPITNNTLFNS